MEFFWEWDSTNVMHHLGMQMFLSYAKVWQRQILNWLKLMRHFVAVVTSLGLQNEPVSCSHNCKNASLWSILSFTSLSLHLTVSHRLVHKFPCCGAPRTLKFPWGDFYILSLVSITYLRWALVSPSPFPTHHSKSNSSLVFPWHVM